MIPQAFIDRIKDQVKIKDLVEEYVHLKKTSNNLYVGRCPNPEHRDSTASFRVWINSNSWACLGCHSGKKNSKNKIYGSDVIAFIQWIEKVDWIKAVKILAEKYDIPYPDDNFTKILNYNKALSECYVCNLHCKPLQYLYSRGLNDKDIKDYKIGFDFKKITFPLFDKYRNILGFTRRWLVEPEKCTDKYKNSSYNKVFNKKKYLYGIHNFDDDFEELRITEGPIDVILANKYGAKNVVATLGTAFTEEHVQIVKKMGKIPVFIFDGDDAGKKAIKRASEMLADEGLYCKVLLLPNNKDLAEIALEEKENIEDYISSNAITYGTYIVKDILEEYISKTLEIKMKIRPKLSNILKKVPSSEIKEIKNFIFNNFDINL